MPRVAQVNQNNRVIAVSQLHTRFSNPALVWLPDDAPQVIGSEWNPESRQFTLPENDNAVLYTLPEGWVWN